ncbi:hypothetical protein Poly41_22260 [Novipirellula artificiosorum]|uniref:Uncharacterized protein n=1 Tax=Novipirellula artificiosorum TaxID=2528016 RepID=A0A5C6DRV4_9BACT|nr:hypothetical protein Poly41_22260 [Novipirellula artificiosorum]
MDLFVGSDHNDTSNYAACRDNPAASIWLVGSGRFAMEFYDQPSDTLH